MLYFPYIMLGIGIALWSVEKFCSEIFQVPFKIKKFGLLLNKEGHQNQDCPQSLNDKKNGVFHQKSDETQTWALSNEAKQGFMDSRIHLDKEDLELRLPFCYALRTSSVHEEMYGGKLRTTFKQKGRQGYFLAFIITKVTPVLYSFQIGIYFKVLELLLASFLFCFMLYYGDLFGCLISTIATVTTGGSVNDIFQS